MITKRALLICALFGALVLPAPASRGQNRDSDDVRQTWQRVDEIFGALGLHEGSAVADIGAGPGFFTVRLSRAVGRDGRVYAVDVSESVVAALKRRVKSEKLDNVEVVQGTTDDPRLPEGALDAVLIVNAYHEMRQHQEMLAKIRRALKPDGRLVLVEPTAKDRPRSTRDEQAGAHIIAIELASKDLTDASFEVLEQREDFVQRPNDEHEWLLVARKGGTIRMNGYQLSAVSSRQRSRGLTAES
jgi:ubiquinone/menaquinone biosynthesis C-methylase UbiE